MPKTVKFLIVLIVVLSFVLTPLKFCDFHFWNFQAQGEVESIIDHDDVWEKSDNIVLDKNVTIENGATLTIEKGAVITFKGEPVFLTVADGRIIAEGTREEKITFKPDENTWGVWNTYALYFQDTGNNEASFFRHVEFLNGGYYPYVLFQNERGKLLNKAYAAYDDYIPGNAVEYSRGKVHIENSEFKDSFQGAVGINI